MDRRRTTVALAAVALLLGAGSFWDGLYAAGQQLLPVAVVAGALLCVLGAVFVSGVEVVALLLLVAGTGLSLLHPASGDAAAHGPVLVAGWVLAFALGRRLAPTGRLEPVLAATWMAAGPLMVFGGLTAMSYLPAHHSGRLASFLGYPIAVGVLGLLGLAGTLPHLARGRWWAPALAAGNGLAVLLSGSRGVWAVGVLLVAYLAWAQPGLLRRVVWPVACALAGALWAGPAVALQQQGQALLGAGLAVAVSPCLTPGAVPWFQHWRAFQRWWSMGAAGLLAVALAVAPGWPWLLGRATALPLTEGSSVERLTFLRDGLVLAARLPLGAGYRAWTALHLQGASYGYFSAEVHSAPLDLALAFGWAGAAGFLLLLGRFLLGLRHGRQWAPERLVVLAGVGALGLHALLDWDLSYGLFMVPLWMGFGLLAPAGRPAAPGRGASSVPAGVAAALAGLALGAVVLLGASDGAATLADRALAAGQPERAIQHSTLATAVAPWNDLAYSTRGQALSRLGRHEEAEAAFARARRWNEYEPWYAVLDARELAALGRWREAAAAYRTYERLWPWNTAAYEEALEAHLDMLFRANLLGDHAQAAELTANGRAILADLDRQKAKEPPGRPRKPMNIETPVIEQARRELGE